MIKSVYVNTDAYIFLKGIITVTDSYAPASALESNIDV